MPNDLKCPECGNEKGPLEIEAVTYTTITLYEDGSEDDGYGDITWEDDSRCRCVECGFEGVVADFSADKKEAAEPSEAERLYALIQTGLKNLDELNESMQPTDPDDRWGESAPGNWESYEVDHKEIAGDIVSVFERLDLLLSKGAPLPAAWATASRK
jgi:hypothetical protein